MDQVKERIGEAAASFVENGMLVGLGTGSTASFFIKALAKRFHEEGLVIATVSSSLSSEKLARELGLPFVAIDAITSIDLTFDGADEIDPRKRMIKGAGGALLKEKILATHSRELVILVDETKCVDSLGAAKLPVEVVQYGHQLTSLRLNEFATSVALRQRGDGKPFISENGNFLYDLQLKLPIDDVPALNEKIRSIAGVVETGFFINMAGRVVIGQTDGTVTMIS